MQSTLKRLVPPPVRRVLRNGQGAVLDLIDAARGIDLPPHRLRGGYGDIKAVGDEYLRYFIEYAELRPNHKVLDVGSGIGRMALPLTRYLSSEGEYFGFDPGPDGVNWCIEHITPRFPNFHFEVADLRNEFFNPLGKFNPENFRFPYEDQSFDFVFLTSVFTHLLPDAMMNYFFEVGRVLRTGGRSFITYFFINPESTALISEGKSSLSFLYQLKGCWTASPDNPEAAIAFDETEIRNLYQARSMTIEGVKYGRWCGRENDFRGYQDVIIGRK